jgi:hypothetical protein
LAQPNIANSSIWTAGLDGQPSSSPEPIDLSLPLPQSPWLELPREVQAALVTQLENADLFDNNPALLEKFENWRKEQVLAGRMGSVAQFHFDSFLTKASRNQLLVLYAKIAADGLWYMVKKISWVSEAGGAMLFVSAFTPEETQKRLVGKGFGDWWFASYDAKWGLRSHLSGPQLHFRDGNSALTNVHIDLHNPGDPGNGETTGVLGELGQAIEHRELDLVHRNETHTIENLREGVKSEGIKVRSSD